MKSLLLLLFFIAVSSAQNCLSSADRLINKRCFTFVNQQLSYQDARDWCHFRNNVTFSYLATVPDANTANFLASIAHTLFNNNGGYFWIGLSRYNTSSKFQWDDGTPVSWTNFQLQNSQNYVAESITNAKWTTYPNDNKYNFICSYDPNGSQTGRPTYPPDSTTAPWGTTAETDTPPGPTPTASPNCTPSTPTTFLFAYSNDLEPSIVLDVFKSFNEFSSTNFPYLGSIRFDSTVEDEIKFDLNFEDWNRTIYENLPDPKQSFEDAGTGSDVLKVIDKFLHNSRYPVCGSRILVLLKRYPNESDTNFLTGQLMQYHSYISVITSITPSGGLSFSTMYKLTSQTNGFGVFSYDEDFGKTISFVPTVYSSYLVYAFDVELSSTGKKYLQLPKMYLPYNNDYWLAMTIQDHGPLDSFQNMTLHWDGDALYKTKEQVLKLFGNSNHVNSWAQYDGGDYSLELQINYSDQKRELIQIRFCSPVPIDYWIPYN